MGHQWSIAEWQDYSYARAVKKNMAVAAIWLGLVDSQSSIESGTKFLCM